MVIRQLLREFRQLLNQVYCAVVGHDMKRASPPFHPDLVTCKRCYLVDYSS